MQFLRARALRHATVGRQFIPLFYSYFFSWERFEMYSNLIGKQPTISISIAPAEIINLNGAFN